MTKVVIQQLPAAPKTYDPAEQQSVRKLISSMLYRLAEPLQKWTVTGSLSSRTYDANTATAPETNAALAQLIADLREKGVLG